MSPSFATGATTGVRATIAQTDPVITTGSRVIGSGDRRFSPSQGRTTICCGLCRPTIYDMRELEWREKIDLAGFVCVLFGTQFNLITGIENH